MNFLILIPINLMLIILFCGYFLYIVDSERDDFETQLDILIDKLIKDSRVKNIYDELTDDEKVKYKFAIVESINLVRDNIDKDKLNEKVLENNDKIKRNSLIVLFSIIIISITLLFYFNNYNDIYESLKENLILAFVIIVIEFTFFNIITKKYISINPNKIEGYIGEDIITWLKNNNKI